MLRVKSDTQRKYWLQSDEQSKLLKRKERFGALVSGGGDDAEVSLAMPYFILSLIVPIFIKKELQIGDM